MNLENTNVTKGVLFPMRHRRPTSTQIGQSHFSSPERAARLLAAAGGDAEHAQRIDDVDEELELAHPRLSAGAAWVVAIAASVAVWLVLGAIAFGVWELVR